MTSTNKPIIVALCLILFFTVLSISPANATTENNYKNETNLLPKISESTHMENGYKANIIINPITTGIYAKENGYKIDLSINKEGIGGKLTENNYKLDLIPEKTFPDMILNITVEPSPPVGGIQIPVDKLSLLTPWIALTTTIISAIAITAAILKHRKKQ